MIVFDRARTALLDVVAVLEKHGVEISERMRRELEDVLRTHSRCDFESGRAEGFTQGEDAGRRDING
jgi:hypothetical protein